MIKHLCNGSKLVEIPACAGTTESGDARRSVLPQGETQEGCGDQALGPASSAGHRAMAGGEADYGVGE